MKASGGDPRHALRRIDGGQIRFAAADVHALRDLRSLHLQNVKGLRLIVGVHDKEEQQHAREQNGKTNQKCVAKDFCRHASSPPIL